MPGQQPRGALNVKISWRTRGDPAARRTVLTDIQLQTH
jgi:hypothetical protein